MDTNCGLFIVNGGSEKNDPFLFLTLFFKKVKSQVVVVSSRGRMSQGGRVKGVGI
jgi:hypothetical protein